MNNDEKLLAAISGKEFEDIFIIGKGASIDELQSDLLKGKIIINANDSESIVCGDIGVFHHDWVLDHFESVRPRCHLYVTNRTGPSGVQILPARYLSNDAEIDLFIERFFDHETLWLENAVVLSCLRVANEIAKSLGMRKRVFLLGFDFSLENGFSVLVENELHGKDSAYVNHIIRTQESYLERLLLEKDRLDIDILHVGNRPFSHYTVGAFNALLAATRERLRIPVLPFKTEVNEQAVKVVAEITTNHFGDMERLKVMILLAKESGADFIKLQKRDVETFYKKDILSKAYKSPFGSTFRDYRHGLELTKDDFALVESFCKDIGIGWFVSVLDEPSYEFIKQFDPQLIKLPSTISEKKHYLTKVGREWGNELIISTGMTDADYEGFILQTFKKANKIYLLQCTSAYPTPEDDAAIGIIRHYRDLSHSDPRIVPGFSSHDIGSLCSQLAVAAGAKMIEKHVKLGSVQWGHFDEVALDLSMSEFRDYVRDVRRAERIVGSEQKRIRDSEHHKY